LTAEYKRVTKNLRGQKNLPFNLFISIKRL
jgi:hypothetical protein